MKKYSLGNEIKLKNAVSGSGFEMEGYYVWCGFAVKEGDTYYLFAARWKKETGFPLGYLANSEIVLATTDDLSKPFQFKKVIIDKREGAYWDSMMAHNPFILKVDSGYVLYYIGSPDGGTETRAIGYAYAESLEGPWKRSDKAIALPPNANNPSAVFTEEGDILLYFRDGHCKPHIARAKSFDGEYELVAQNIFQGGAVEDMFVFRTEEGYEMIAEDCVGVFTGLAKGGVRFTSVDGVHWDGKNARQAYDFRVTYLNAEFPDPNGLLETIYEDFTKFLTLTGIHGHTVPVRIVETETEVFESYVIEINEKEVVIQTGDTEGARRALVWLEDEMLRREGPYLPKGRIERTPHIAKRITRCFFSPINRPPKYGDELSDDIDYYPEEYLNRLMHDGTNGVWIYTRFSDLVDSSYLTHYGRGREPRLEKLNRVIAKCARYGIDVYVFAIEPVALSPEDAKKHPEAGGSVLRDGGKTFCTNTEFGREFCREAGRKLFEYAPGLGGFISITYGERTTSCASARRNCTCPHCKDIPPGQVLSQAVDALTAGMKEAKPSATLVSWTYGHRLWRFEDICEYVRTAPGGVALMQNFDDMGFEDQLGRMRMAIGLFGEAKEKNRARWQLETLSGDRTHMRVAISRNSIAWDGQLPMRMLVQSWELDSGLQKAIWCEEKNPKYRLGISYSTCELGWLMP